MLAILLGGGVAIYQHLTRPQTPWDTYVADMKGFVTEWVRYGVQDGTLCERLAKVRRNYRYFWRNHPDRSQFRGATPEDRQQMEGWLTQVLTDQGCPA